MIIPIADELREKSEFHEANSADWTLYQLAYEGTQALIKSGILEDSKRSDPDVEFREQAAWGMDLTQWIIDIIADFVNTVPYEEVWGRVLDEDWAFQAFLKDCDLYGTNWAVFWNDARRATYATGMTGTLVDRAGTITENATQEKENNIYPYVAQFSPLKVLIAEYGRNEASNRPELVYLKVLEPGGVYKIWTQEEWGSYRIQRENGVDKVIEIDTGTYKLGQIPYSWFFNLKSVFDRHLGTSDAKLSAIIDKSIIKMTADMAQIINASAYLMLALPEAMMMDREKDIESGPNVIIPFPAEDNAKPFWLTPDVEGPLNGILSVMAEEEKAVIRSKNLSAIFSTESKAARSEESIQQALKFLEAMLNRKVDNEIEARQNVIKWWLKWQNKSELFDEISISHPKTYDIKELIITMDDALTGKTVIRSSETFRKELDKRLVDRFINDLPDATKQKIDKEIDAAKEVLPDSVSDFKEV